MSEQKLTISHESKVIRLSPETQEILMRSIFDNFPQVLDKIHEAIQKRQDNEIVQYKIDTDRIIEINRMAFDCLSLISEEERSKVVLEAMDKTFKQLSEARKKPSILERIFGKRD